MVVSNQAMDNTDIQMSRMKTITTLTREKLKKFTSSLKNSPNTGKDSKRVLQQAKLALDDRILALEKEMQQLKQEANANRDVAQNMRSKWNYDNAKMNVLLEMLVVKILESPKSVQIGHVPVKDENLQ